MIFSSVGGKIIKRSILAKYYCKNEKNKNRWQAAHLD